MTTAVATRARIAPMFRGLSIRCDSYSDGRGPVNCSNEVYFGKLGREAVGGRFLSDHIEEKGLSLFGFCNNGHKVSVSHIDTIPRVANTQIVEHMAEGAVDLCGLNQFILSLESIDW